MRLVMTGTKMITEGADLIAWEPFQDGAALQEVLQLVALFVETDE